MNKSPQEKTEVVLEGISAVSGIVSGTAVLFDRSSTIKNFNDVINLNHEEELEKFKKAVALVETELHRLSRFADRHASDDTGDILAMQKEILLDPELHNKVNELISTGKYTADNAVYEAFDVYIDLIKSTGKSLITSRLIDLRDIRNRIMRAISQKQIPQNYNNDSIIIADEFSPSEIIMLTRQNIRGFASDYGGLTSHASIVAGSMGLPMVIDTQLVSRYANNGDTLIIDGNEGKVILNPQEQTISQYNVALDEHDEAETKRKSIIDEPNQTSCGYPFILRANVEFDEELNRINEVKADGVGLLRTESFFLSETEEEIDVDAQIRFYRKALENSAGHTVTIRLLDVGGDKVLEPDIKEANPFLGWRGIRVLLDRRDLLRAQLEALLRVSAEFPGRVRVLIPMISSLEELQEVRKEIDRVYKVLKRRNCNADNSLRLGVMVEVPSVAIQADLFARHSDFLSIGSNDLTQFLLAVDRNNARISKLFRQLHPSVWRMITQTVKAAQKYNKPVGLCGEMAANPMIACLLLGMGMDELSVATPNIVKVKQVLRNMTMKDMKTWADRMDLAETVSEVNELASNWNKKYSETLGGATTKIHRL